MEGCQGCGFKNCIYKLNKNLRHDHGRTNTCLGTLERHRVSMVPLRDFRMLNLCSRLGCLQRPQGKCRNARIRKSARLTLCQVRDIKLEEENIRVNPDHQDGPHDLPKTPAECKARMEKTNEAIRLVSCPFSVPCTRALIDFSLFHFFI